jgi:sporulation protein YlmC with PRC-barrel domain
MKKIPAIAICMATALAGYTSLAQSSSGQAKDENPSQSSSQSLNSSGSSASSKDSTSSQSLHSSSASSSMPDQSTSGPIRASKLIGINVSAKDGTNLGQVQDLIVNPNTGKIRFALVGHGFMAGAGETLFPVPWKAVNVQSEKQFVLNVDDQKLKSAPAWTETQIEQPDYQLRIFRFYNIQPETEMGGPGQSGEQSGQGQGSSSGLNSSNSQSSGSSSSTSPSNSANQHSQQSSSQDK